MFLSPPAGLSLGCVGIRRLVDVQGSYKYSDLKRKTADKRLSSVLRVKTHSYTSSAYAKMLRNIRKAHGLAEIIWNYPMNI